MTETFWKPEPKEPWRDWRTYSMLGPIMSGALGACIFFALGLAFAEVINIGPGWRKFLVLTASFTVAFGSTFGSIGSGIEVFRKSYLGEAKGWDWISLSISILTTMVGMVMGFAALLAATEEWGRIATIYGCIVVGGFAALDSSGDMIELGGLFGSYDRRLDEYKRWQYENGLGVQSKSAEFESTLGQLLREQTALDSRIRNLAQGIERLDRRWTWPQSKKSDFESILAGLNGDAPELDRESAILLLASRELLPPSDQTLSRWIREVTI